MRAAYIRIMGGPHALRIPEWRQARLGRPPPKHDGLRIASADQPVACRGEPREANGAGLSKQGPRRKDREIRGPAQHFCIETAAEEVLSQRVHGERAYPHGVPLIDAARLAAGGVPHDDVTVPAAADERSPTR